MQKKQTVYLKMIKCYSNSNLQIKFDYNLGWNHVQFSVRQDDVDKTFQFCISHLRYFVSPFSCVHSKQRNQNNF